MSTTTGDVRMLRARCAGGVVAPGERGWDAARRAFNLAVDQRPAAVALPADAEDVAAVVRFAREAGLRVAAQATGRGAGALGPLHDALLVRTSAMRGVDVDPVSSRARIDAGARLGEVAERASALGHAPLGGLSPSAGAVGDSLAGGAGWLSRKHGLQSNAIVAVELVGADGWLVRADRRREPELFWALRGGGGNFGVVTAIEVELKPLVEVHAGALHFPLDRGRQVLHAWREWTAGLPDELTSVARIASGAPGARSFATVAAAYVGDAASASELLQPLRELGPQLDTFATVAPAALAGLHPEPRRPLPLLSDHLLLADLPAAAIDALVDAAGPGSGSPLASVELRHLGGEAGRSRPGAGALGALAGSFALVALGVPRDARHAAAIADRLERVTAAVGRHAAGVDLGLAERRVDPRRAFAPDVLARLRAARMRYDPTGLFQANHPIAPAPEPCRGGAASRPTRHARWGPGGRRRGPAAAYARGGSR